MIQPQLTVPEAFDLFAQRLRVTDAEELCAQRRHQEILMILRPWFHIETSFYGGSFARRTCVKPIRAADLFIQLGHKNLAYRVRRPALAVQAFGNALAPGFGYGMLRRARGRIILDLFGGGGHFAEPIQTINIIPVFAEEGAFAIPHRVDDAWIKADLQQHALAARRAENALPGHWLTCVQMVKTWHFNAGRRQGGQNQTAAQVPLSAGDFGDPAPGAAGAQLRPAAREVF